MSERKGKQPVRQTAPADSAIATSEIFASDKVVATIRKLPWSRRDEPCWPLPKQK
jgi:hypothetical protein